MNLNICLLVGWSVIISEKSGKLHYHAPIVAIVLTFIYAEKKDPNDREETYGIHITHLSQRRNSILLELHKNIPFPRSVHIFLC